MDKGKTGHRRKAAAAGMLQINFLRESDQNARFKMINCGDFLSPFIQFSSLATLGRSYGNNVTRVRMQQSI